MKDLARCAYSYASPTIGSSHVRWKWTDASRICVLGMMDRSVVALAQSLGVRGLAMRDVRHFAAGRLPDGCAFELAVHPSDPDTI